MTGVTKSGGLVRSRTVRGCSSTLAARRLAVLLGLAATLTLPAASGTASPTNRVAELRARDTSLAARERAATQELYSIEAQLLRSRAALAAIAAKREATQSRLTRLRIELDAAWQSAYVAEERLGSRIRALYQGDRVDPVAVLLGAESLDEAVRGLDGLRNLASSDRALLQELRHARAQLTTTKRRVAARVAELRQAEEAAAATTAGLEAAGAERRAYLAALARERGFTARRLDRVRQTARAAGRRAETVSVDAAAPAAEGATPVPVYAGGMQTMTVTATGYSIRGRTATGLQTGWGIAAVDPSVIPLGTRITIPGYGEAIAADTGGAVRGAEIDLWFPTVAEALAWGRRTVTVTLHGQ
jgi:3D (Asp-Asp-Asp) domain-containing protein/septal ring factor EnvC (AmiA/AmiB activator)